MFPLHPITSDYADFTEPELATLRESLRQHGLMVPIVIWHDQIVDGRHRARLCEELGIELRVTDITEQYPAEEKMTAYVRALNEHRRANTKPLTNAEKRARIEAALKADPDPPNLAIAKMLGVDDKTVASVRAELERRSELPNVSANGDNTRIDTKGRRQPARKSRRPAPSPKTKTTVEPSQDVEQPGPKPEQPIESNTWPCQAPPVAPPPPVAYSASEDPFDAAYADLEADYGRWLMLAKEILRAPIILEHEAVLQLGRRLKHAHDIAVGIEWYMRFANNAAGQREACDLRHRLARRLGLLLIELEKAGLRTIQCPDNFKIGTPTGLITLGHLNISRMQSQYFRRLVKLPDAAFEAQLATANAGPRRRDGRRRSSRRKIAVKKNGRCRRNRARSKSSRPAPNRGSPKASPP